MKKTFFLIMIGAIVFASKTYCQSITLTPNTQSIIDNLTLEFEGVVETFVKK